MAMQLHGTVSSRMNEMEKEALMSYKDTLVNSIDPLVIARQLAVTGCISQSFYDIIRARYITEVSRTEISEHLIYNLQFHTNIIALIQALDRCGYSKLSSALFMTFIKMHTGFHEVGKNRNTDRKNLHSLFGKLKIMIHDAQFRNPREFLRNLAKRFMKQFNEETNEAKKQKIADKCVVVLGAEIDAHAITFNSDLPNNEMFSEMKLLVPYTENTLISDVVYYGRLANANAIAKKFEDGEDMLKEARVRAYNTSPCLELVNMLYIEVYFLLWQYEETPTKPIRDLLMMWGRIGLESLEEEEYGTKLLWRRMFILRMVFCLLGIGNRANIIFGACIDDECASIAELLLTKFDQYFQDIEQRREMFYSVARARLCQYRGQHSEAFLHVCKAEKLSISGNFKEMEFIKQYKSIILVEDNNKTLSEEVMDSTCSIHRKTNELISGDLPHRQCHIGDHHLFNLPEIIDSEETELKQPVLSVWQVPRNHICQLSSCNKDDSALHDPPGNELNDKYCIKRYTAETENCTVCSSELFGIYTGNQHILNLLETTDSEETEHKQQVLSKNQVTPNHICQLSSYSNDYSVLHDPPVNTLHENYCNGRHTTESEKCILSSSELFGDGLEHECTSTMNKVIIEEKTFQQDCSQTCMSPGYADYMNNIERLNSMVLFEERGEPEGASIVDDKWIQQVNIFVMYRPR